jgi:endonuclease/exonuclease/phosphatase family metal-dependent hydrolase
MYENNYCDQAKPVAKFLSELKTGIVVLNEMRGMIEEDHFEKFKEDAGFKYGEIIYPTTKTLKRSFPTAILSKYKFVIVGHKESGEFWHTFSHAYFPRFDLSVYFTHLTPKNYRDRKKEASTMIKVMKENKARYCILAGDLNTLSHQDKYNTDHILQKDTSIKKFTTEKNKINYFVTQQLDKFMFDAYHAQPHTPLNFGHTVGTATNEDKAHFGKLRLDYFFVNKNLVKKIKGCDSIRNHDTEGLSDHYPVELILDNL